MNRFALCSFASIAYSFITIAFSATAEVYARDSADPRPNVVWIISDDLCPELGCYGYAGVATPNLDRLAANGAMYTRAFSTSPVCSASRTAFQTGLYQTTVGGHHHDTRVYPELPESVPTVTGLMQQAGYFVCNGNGIDPESRKQAKSHLNFVYDKRTFFDGIDWAQRADGQPFFAQIQIKQPHRPFEYTSKSRPDVVIPPYFPDHPVTRADWANYLNSVEVMDAKVGVILDRLDKEGLADNTLVMFFGDHGRPHVRCKQWLYEGGLHVPLIVRWPGKVEAGTTRTELTSLLDLMPTTIAAAGISPTTIRSAPLPGRDLMNDRAPKHDRLFAARDRCGDAVDRIRSVRTERFKYIRNFHPELPYLQHSGYKKLGYPVLTVMRVLDASGQWDSPFMADTRPPEELYDLESDPHEMHNLASSPAHASTLISLREAIDQWIVETKDQGEIDESTYVDIEALKAEKWSWYERTMKRRGLAGNVMDRDYLDWIRKDLGVPQRPNILYVYVDDMGFGSIGPNGQWARRDAGLPFVRTPNIDSIARSGVNFTRGYGCHVCSPARSSQQSGFHQGHTFADRNDPDNARKAMRQDDVLIGDALSAAGYTTGYWGKWGYGASKNQDNPVVQNIQTLPTSHGYKHVLAELHHVRAHTFFQPTLWQAPAPEGAIGGIHLIPNTLLSRQAAAGFPTKPTMKTTDGYPQRAYCDDSYAMAALDFVRHQSVTYNETGKPFFGLFAAQIPHAPFGEIDQLPEWDAVYRDDPAFAKLNPQTRQWAAMVTRIDAHVGNLLQALDDPNGDGDVSDSVAANTLVVFQSDNGGPGGPNNNELDANAGLRGVKGTIYEGGIRVPLVIRWPEMINDLSTLRAGTNCDKIVDVTDLLPTFCEIAEQAAPFGIDGVSVAPTLAGVPRDRFNGQRQREFVIHEAGSGASIITADWKLVLTRQKKVALFDLQADPSETVDVAADHPDVVRRLKSTLIDERVTEPRGFANTYHHWLSDDGASIAAADSWSDYSYENAGEIYISESGAPTIAWTAAMHNSSDVPNTAVADGDVEFLSLDIEGKRSAPQNLRVQANVSVTGRNGIKVGNHGRVELLGSRLQSARWVEIDRAGAVSGHGRIECDVFNDGMIQVTGDQLAIQGDLHQSARATLTVEVQDVSKRSGLAVDGIARIRGDLELRVLSDAAVRPGDQIQVVTANKIEGRFNQATVWTEQGDGFDVRYESGRVSLIAK